MTDYSDAGEKIKEVYYYQGIVAFDDGQMDVAKTLFEKVGDFQDAKDWIAQIEEAEKERIYNTALDAMNDGNFDLAIRKFKSLSGYRDSKLLAEKAKVSELKLESDEMNKDPDIMTLSDVKKLEKWIDKVKISNLVNNEELETLVKQSYYAIGQYRFNNKDYEQAVNSYKAAGDYLDASSKMQECRSAKFMSLIDMGDIYKAIEYYNKYKAELSSGGSTDEYILIEPGSQGEIVKELLSLLAPIGINAKIPAGEDTYSDDYVAAVQKLEKHFGLNADGKVSLDEYAVLKDAIYPGLKSSRVRNLLEKLADLSYLSKLPDEHDTYEKKYVSAVKKAEQKMGLFVDGIITNKEFDAIMAKKVQVPSVPSDLKVSTKNGLVTITWKKVPEALFYEVNCRPALDIYETTEGNKLILKDVEKGKFFTIYLKACKYTVSSQETSIQVATPAH